MKTTKEQRDAVRRGLEANRDGLGITDFMLAVLDDLDEANSTIEDQNYQLVHIGDAHRKMGRGRPLDGNLRAKHRAGYGLLTCKSCGWKGTPHAAPMGDMAAFSKVLERGDVHHHVNDHGELKIEDSDCHGMSGFQLAFFFNTTTGNLVTFECVY